MKQKKDIHVLYIITKLELGGAQKVCLSLFQGLNNLGHTSTLVSGAEGILTKGLTQHPLVHLIPTFTREISFSGIVNEIKNFFKLVKLIRSYKNQYQNFIVHTHSTKAGIIGRWAAFFAGAKMRIHTVHGYAFHPHQKWFVWLCTYLAELITSLITTHFVCVSSQDVKISIRLFPRFEKKHSIIRAAVDTQELYNPAQSTSQYPQYGESFIFGTIACFKPQKNLFDLLNAFKTVHTKHAHTRLEIIGDGVLREAITDWILYNNLQNVITLHGWQHTIAPIISQWHAFVLSSLWEGLPCAIIEARIAHLPVISYDTGGIHDVIIHGVNGLLYQQKDIAGLAKGMSEICSNKKLFEQLKMHNDDLRDFSTPYMVEQHIRLYNSLLRHRLSLQ